MVAMLLLPKGQCCTTMCSQLMLQNIVVGMLYMKRSIHNVATLLWYNPNCNIQGVPQFAKEKRSSFYCILSYVYVILFNSF